MPVKRRKAKARTSELTDLEYLFLTDGLTPDHPVRLAEENRWQVYELECNCRLGSAQPIVDRLWERFGAQITEDWIRDRPGTRPSLWWAYDAPRDDDRIEPRRRLGGTGTANHDVLNYVERYHLGVPDDWTDAEDVETFGTGNHDFAGVPIDPNDPPIFESQAAYLGRLGLMKPAERCRLRPIDFEPERVR